MGEEVTDIIIIISNRHYFLLIKGLEFLGASLTFAVKISNFCLLGP